MSENINFEQAVIGALLANPDNYDRVCDVVSVNDFYALECAQNFQAIESLINDNQPVDVITVNDKRAALGFGEGFAGLAECQAYTPSSHNVKYYAGRVRDGATVRRLLAVASTIAEMANQEGVRVGEKIDKAQSLLSQLTGETDTQCEQINSTLRSLIDTVEYRNQNKGQLSGLNTGFDVLNSRYLGLQKQNLILLAARPSMGKTTIAMNIAEHVAIRENRAVLFFSMEMSKAELVERLVASQGGLNTRSLKTGDLKEDDWPKLSAAVGKLKDKKLFIDDTPALHINQIKARARAHKRKHDTALIVVDYIGLAKYDARSREEGIGQISAGLKAIAKELDIPVIALSQLNRECEKRPNKRPLLSDLRDSGTLEQDADIVTFLYRDEVYNEDSQHKGLAEVITRKFRAGEIGMDYIESKLQFCRFENFNGNVQPIKEVSGFSDYS